MKAISSLQIENDRFLVTEWKFPPGADTGFHLHLHDYIVVPLTTGILRLEDTSGQHEVRLDTGKSYSREAGVAHNVVNINNFEFCFIEIELK